MRNGAYRIRGTAESLDGQQIAMNGEYNIVVRERIRGLYADVDERIVATHTISTNNPTTVINNVRTIYPPTIQPFTGKHCLKVSDLMLISEPDGFQLFVDQTNCPYADDRTLRFVVNVAVEHLGTYGLELIYLIGGRATGIRSDSTPAPDVSDHDFVVVVSDSAPDDIMTGQDNWREFYNTLNNLRVSADLRSIYVYVVKASTFENERDQDGSVSSRTRKGVLIAQPIRSS